MEIMGMGNFFLSSHLYVCFKMQIFILESFVYSWKQDESKAALPINWESAGAIGGENREKSLNPVA